MSNVIPLHGRRPGRETFAATSDVAEAFGMAALLIREWTDTTMQVRLGQVVLVDLDHLPLAPPYPPEPTVNFAGQAKLVSEVVEAASVLVSRPFPPLVRLLFALWDQDDGGPVLSYADAIEFAEGMIDIVREEQTVPPRLRNGGAA